MRCSRKDFRKNESCEYVVIIVVEPGLSLGRVSVSSSLHPCTLVGAFSCSCLSVTFSSQYLSLKRSGAKQHSEGNMWSISSEVRLPLDTGRGLCATSGLNIYLFFK